MNLLPYIRERISPRKRLVRRYISGSGLELGALHSPTPAPQAATVTYVDRYGLEELRGHYPELKGQGLAPVDVMDDAETLSTFSAGSQDFVIASHVLEHCEDPIAAFFNWLRVLKPGGIAFVAVPNKDSTFDAPRPVTTWDHVLEDYRRGAVHSRAEHYMEWSLLVAGKVGGAAEEYAKAMEENLYSIHFHVWDTKAFRGFVDACLEISPVKFSVEEFLDCRREILLVVRT